MNQIFGETTYLVTLNVISTPMVPPNMAGKTYAQYKKLLLLPSAGINANSSTESKNPNPEMIINAVLGMTCITKPPQMARTMPPTARGVNHAAV